jgi:hypothetical protein
MRHVRLLLTVLFITFLSLNAFGQFSSAPGYVPGAPMAVTDEIITLNYDGENFDAIGLTAGGSFEVAARFLPAQTGPLTGGLLKWVRIYINDVPSPATLKIYGNGTATAPGALLHSQALTSLSALAWNEITLSTPVAIDGLDLWVSYEVTHTAGTFPAGCDAGPANANGDWIFFSGTWQHLAALGLNYNWNIRALVDYIVPVELTSFAANVVNGTVQISWSTSTELNNRGFEVQRKSEGSEFLTAAFIQGSGTTTEQKTYSFNEKLESGVYVYRLKQVDFDGRFSYSDEVEVDLNAAKDYQLIQNYPNPFNPSTVISFNLPVDSRVSVKVFNVIGELVSELANSSFTAGSHNLEFNAAGLNSGVYFYSINVSGTDGSSFASTKKMILTK